jgi:hypothetical protein
VVLLKVDSGFLPPRVAYQVLQSVLLSCHEVGAATDQLEVVGWSQIGAGSCHLFPQPAFGGYLRFGVPVLRGLTRFILPAPQQESLLALCELVAGLPNSL